MKNQNIKEQIVFRQLLPIIRNRNRFMSLDSDIFNQNSQPQVWGIIIQEHGQNIKGLSQLEDRVKVNQQDGSGGKTRNDQETNSRRSDQSTPLKVQRRRRSLAVRKQLSRTSLSKFNRDRNRSFMQRLNEFKHRTPTPKYQPDKCNGINPDEDFNPQLEPDPDINDGQVHSTDEMVNRESKLQLFSDDEQYDSEESIIEDQTSIVIPERKVEDFLPYIEMENYLHHDDFVPGRFPLNPGLPYQHRYQRYYPRSHNDHRINYYVHIKKIPGLKIISYNCAFNIHNQTKMDKKIFLYTKRRQKMRQAVKVILKYMYDGYDFILLQQACDPEFQKLLVQAIQQFNDLKGEMYFYPQHLDKETNSLRFTSILTKHQVKIGQFNFKIDEIPGHPDYHPRLPIQAFCEFRVKIHDKWENICIFCAHFKSNRGHQASLSGQVRMKQIDAVQKFSKKFDRFYVIGDVNIPTSSPFHRQNNLANQKFFDVIYYGISEIRGTFLYRTKGKYVRPQRNDRVWLDKKKENVLSTSVLMTYHDILLQACEDLDLDQTKLLQQGGDEFTYITVTDHTILDIEIMFLK